MSKLHPESCERRAACRTACPLEAGNRARVTGALLSSAYMTWTSRDMPFLGTERDASIYRVSAKSLAEGTRYRIASLPGWQWQAKYPPLFPLFRSMARRASLEFPGQLPLATLSSRLLLLYKFDRDKPALPGTLPNARRQKP